jgi:hypothetical protein
MTETIQAYFNSSRDTKEGVKQDFFESLDGALTKDIESVEYIATSTEQHPATVRFTTEADVEAVILEVEWYLGGRFGSVGVVKVPPESPE